jgi:hypothetical protein
MDDPKPTRPRWKRKRWIAAAVLLLLAGYPASLGPVDYAVARAWLPLGPAAAAYEPLSWMMRPFPAVQSLMNRYGVWWTTLGYRHATGDEPVMIDGRAFGPSGE